MDIDILEPNAFDPDRHYYPRTLNATLHPLVSVFMRMSTERVVARYCQLHPYADKTKLEEIMTTSPRYLRWSGSDVFNVSTEAGVRQKLIVETNSCPSGQKSFPLLDEDQEEGGYGRLIRHTYLPLIKKKLKRDNDGVLVVLYDKNPMESSGYAQVIATETGRPVYFVPCMRKDPERFIEIRDQELWLNLPVGARRVICAYRYVTQRPWTRLPINLKTPILNPLIACLAGGRNKTSAAKAYEAFNGEFRPYGLEILTPQSFTNVRKAEVPMILSRFGGRGVVKVPYLNAGQGIFTLVNQRELDAFMEEDHPYDEFIVQQLVGNFRWSSTTSHGKVFHIGTVPDKRGNVYVFDMRMMISWQGDVYRPVAMYARRAPMPMAAELDEGTHSFQVLGTNLSRKIGEEQWDTEPQRLLMMDRRDFGKLGMGLDDLIESFIQSVMANRAIDDLAKKLVKRGGGLRQDLFRSLNNDAELLNEIREELPVARTGGKG